MEQALLHHNVNFTESPHIQREELMHFVKLQRLDILELQGIVTLDFMEVFIDS